MNKKIMIAIMKLDQINWTEIKMQKNVQYDDDVNFVIFFSDIFGFRVNHCIRAFIRDYCVCVTNINRIKNHRNRTQAISSAREHKSLYINIR